MESEEQVRAIHQLFYWQQDPNATNFSALLYTLFQKADPENLEKLSKGFPEQAQAIRRWNAAGNYGNDLFLEYGLIKPNV